MPVVAPDATAVLGPIIWSGRVVSVSRADIVNRLTNYLEVSLTATNGVAAPGGQPPGHLSDVKVGGYLLAQNGDYYQLEDGTGRYELEGTTYTYRNLSVKSSQNQDGTVTTYGSLEVFEPGYAAGQVVQLTSANLGYLAQSFTITNVIMTFVGVPRVPAYVIEFGDAYQTLQQAGGGVLTKQGSTAVTQSGVVMPAGVLGYAQVTADQAAITAIVDLTGLAVTVTTGTGRRIRVSGYCLFQSDTASDHTSLTIAEGAAALVVSYQPLSPTATRPSVALAEVILTPTAGVHTYKLRGARIGGAGIVTMKADGGTTYGPAFIKVEDIGT